MNIWKGLRNKLNRWPRRFRVEVRDGDCRLLDFTFITAYSWDDVMRQSSKFAQDVLSSEPAAEALDEVYWNYEEV